MSFSSFLIGSGIGGALVYGSLTCHVLRTSTGVEVIPKSAATFAETYLDVRTFTLSDWARHRLLVTDIVTARKEHLFAGAPVFTRSPVETTRTRLDTTRVDTAQRDPQLRPGNLNYR